MGSTVTRLAANPLQIRARDQRDASGLRARAKAVAEIAARHADAVDRDARFPNGSLRRHPRAKTARHADPGRARRRGGERRRRRRRLLILGGACASTGDDLRDASGQGRLPRPPCARQCLAARLPAPDRGRAIAARLVDDRRRQWRRYPLQRSAPSSCTARASPSSATPRSSPTARTPTASSRRRAAPRAAASSDQVLVAFLKAGLHAGARPSRWDTLGMRGTCSIGFMLRAEGEADQVLPEPYERIHSQTMAPYRASVLERRLAGRRRRRGAARARLRAPGGARFGRPHAARPRPISRARGCRSRPCAARCRRRLRDLRAPTRPSPAGSTAIDAQLALNFLKVEASELAVDDRDERDARLRARRLSQRQRIRDGPVSARHPLRRRS